MFKDGVDMRIKDFESNGRQFTERFVLLCADCIICLMFIIFSHSRAYPSLSGKWTRQWILDDKLMRVQALKWMCEGIKDSVTKDHGMFCISDFQNYLNNELLPKWQVPKNTLPRRAQNVDLTSEFLQVSWSTTRSWAIASRAKFKKHTKGYYVDGHDRTDVLEHRPEWLSKELKLEL